MNSTEENLFYTLFSERILELIILPTEQCNLRCIYCYEDFLSGRMEKETIDSIKALLQKRAPQLSHLRIGWFGGEPLLVKDIVKSISSYAKSLTKNHPELYFDSGMSTNGYYLTIKTAEELVLSGVNEFQITLDGPAYYHDKVRKQRNGKGTFNKIWKNLIDLKNSNIDFKINLRIHFSKDNIDVLGDLIDLLKTNFIGDNRFKFFFKSVEELGGKNDGQIKCFFGQEKDRILKNLSQIFDGQLSTITNGTSPYICYAGRPTSIVIRHDGRLAKCTVGLDEPYNNIGYLRHNGILEIDQEKIRKWFKGAVSLNREILQCPKAYL